MRRLLLGAGLLLGVLGTAVADDWPQWRGPKRDGISAEKGLLQEWPKGGPKLLWKTAKLGDGATYSTPAIVRGRIYLLSSQGGREVLQALDEKDGNVLWTKPVGNIGKNQGPQYPGPRSTPTVDGDLVFALGSDGDLVCYDAEKGEKRWSKHLRNDFGGVMGMWAYSESPLVDGDNVVCTPGGSKATVVALNKRSGEVVWKAQVPGGDKAAYSSLVVGEVDGVRQYITFLHAGLVAVEARTGKFLWRSTATSNTTSNIPTPVFHDGYVYSASGKGSGGLAKLTASDGKVTATSVYTDKKLANKIGGVVVVDGHVYSAGGSTLICAEFATGKIKWNERCVGTGSVCYADGCIYVRGENGEVALVEANPRAYKEKGRFQQPDRSSKTAWTYPVVANGCFYLRDQGVLLCYDVKAAR